MFCLGLFSVTAQVTCVREMLVAFHGNELTVGVVLSTWLASISLGAFAARPVLARVASTDRLQRVLCVLGGGLALLLPAQVHWIRIARSAFGVPVGEYASLGAVFGCAAVAFFPSCAMIGLFFPIACARLDLARRADGVGDPAVGPAGRVYTWEAVGSMLGGVVLTYLLLPVLSPLRIVAAGCGVALFMAAINTRGRLLRPVWALLAVAALAAAVVPPVLDGAEDRSVRARWRAFGVLPAEAEAGRATDGPTVRLVGHEDTIYQNLALTESLGQYALYANGEVVFVFPDPISYEHDIHFVMAQKPDARRVLLLGGNPVGEVPELLKYPLETLVHVALDPGVGRLVRSVAPEAYEAAGGDSRLCRVTRDAARYVKTCEATFDVVLVRAPSPATAGANRFYTREFFLAVKRILAPGGFVQTSVTSSVRLQEEAAELGASVYGAMKAVFPAVLVTAGEENILLGGARDAGLTLDRETLAARSRSAGVKTQYFRPEYFLGSDDIDPEKCRFVLSRFTSAATPVNTDLRPVTYLRHLVLWSRYSDSGLSDVFRKLQDFRGLCRLPILLSGIGGVLLASMLLALAGRRRPGVRRVGRGWARLLIGVVIGTTGFCGMAMEMLLVFVFQGLYGYIYTRIGLIVAMFMLGLVLGAPTGRWMAAKGGRAPWLFMFGVELLLAVFPFAVVLLMRLAAGPEGSLGILRGVEFAIYGCVAIVGWAVGAEFPLGNRLYIDAGGSVGAAAAITDASDHAGAALGSLLVGVLLVPVVGLRMACLALFVVKVMGCTLLYGAYICRGRRRQSTTDT